MPLYEVQVYETVVQEKIYTIEAEDAEVASEMAERGETDSESYVRDVEVAGRAIMSGPTIIIEDGPKP